MSHFQLWLVHIVHKHKTNVLLSDFKGYFSAGKHLKKCAVQMDSNNTFKIFKQFIKVCGKLWTYYKSVFNNGKITPPGLTQDMDAGLLFHNSNDFRSSQLIHTYSKQMSAMERNYFGYCNIVNFEDMRPNPKTSAHYIKTVLYSNIFIYETYDCVSTQWKM